MLAATATVAQGQGASVVIFDDEAAGTCYREASSGFATGGDVLQLAGPDGDKLPLEPAQAFSGTQSALLAWQHGTGGVWEMVIGTDAFRPTDLTGFDSLIVYLNGPEAIADSELPRLGLQDAGAVQTSLVWMSTPRDVRIDAGASGFTAESTTNALLDAR
jgi:hypothetical protein